MWYYAIVTRGEQVLFLTSPKWGHFEFVAGPPKPEHTYLYTTQEDAEKDQRWKHLVQPTDRLEYVRTYQG